MAVVVDFEQIGASALGAELSVNECQVLASVMGAQVFEDGELLVSASGTEHTLFLLVSGEIEIINELGGTDEVMYQMQPGEVAGTRAFVDRSPRKATLRAKGRCVVYTLEPYDFESLLETHPRILYKVMRSLFRITHSNLLRMNQETAQLTDYINRSHGRY